MSYQGWTNYETWAVSLWLSNDESSYHYWRERTQDIIPDDGSKETVVGILAGYLKEEHETFMPEVEGVWSDLLTHAVQQVDWHEIAKGWVDDEWEEK